MKKIENNGIVYRRLRARSFDMRRSSDNHFLYDLSHPLLNREQEIDLLKKFKFGSKKEAARAAESLLAHNQRFILNIASRFQYAKCPMADLVQAGNMGLLEAAKKFQFIRGVRLLTYARWHIEKEMRNHLIRCEALPARREKKPKIFVSLEDIPDSLFSEEAEQEKEVLIKELWRLIEILPTKERQAIILYFQRELSFNESGKRMDYSRERVRCFVNDALALLRKQLTPED